MRVILGIASVLVTCFVCAQNKVHLSVNPSTAEVGETFEISITSTEVGTIDFGEMPDEFLQDYAIQQGSSQHQSNNGQLTTQYYYTISGIIKKPGKYTFGPVTLTRVNKTYVSNEASIEIKPKIKMRGSNITALQMRDPAFGSIEVNKLKLYEGEPLLVRAKIYARYKPTHIKNYLAYEMDGALVRHPIGSHGHLKPFIERLNGENFYAFDYDKNVLFPTAVGTVKVEPFKLSLYKDYNSFPITSSSLSVQILPLPANPPADFIGAVGDFTVNREIPETSFDQGDVIKMIVNVEGSGNLHNISAPQLSLPKGFSVYGDPAVTEEYSFGLRGSEGRIRYEYNIEVTASGATSLPPTSITFFDPNQEKYITVETHEDSLNIKPGKGFDGDDPQDDGKRTNELIVQEFSPRDNSGSAKPGTFFGSGVFWGGVSLPLATAFLFLLFVKTRKNSEKRKEEKLKRNAKTEAITSKLRAAKALVNSNDTRAFYDALDKTLRVAFAIQMHQEDQAVSKQDILKHAASISESFKNKVSSLFANAEIAKFSFGSNLDTREKDLKTLEEVIHTLKSKK